MNSKSIIISIAVSILLTSTAYAQTRDELFKEKYIKSTARKVCDWQLANLHTKTATSSGGTEAVPEKGWIRGVFYIGVMAAYRITQDKKYLEKAMLWGGKNDWQLGPRTKHADDQVVGQTYADLFLIKKDTSMVGDLINTFDNMIANPTPGKVLGWSKNKNWSWCDALFMAPPAMAKIADATSDPKYNYLMNTMWWETYEHLYSKTDSLFYRDDRYKIHGDKTGPLTANGQKIFWGRGNGWVLAGLARTIEALPLDYPTRPAFEKVFIEMAIKIASLQGEDGLWRSSLLDSEEFPAPETSSSGFFCFALAWGINHKLLNKETFLPVVESAWSGLNWALQSNGKLGYVQQVGHDPRKVGKDDSMEYGSAAYLLASEQVLILLR